MPNEKFSLRCQHCDNRIPGFQEWFSQNQQCPECGENIVDVQYADNYSHLKTLINSKEQAQNLWRYFKYLPLDEEHNVVSFGEGVVPIERWKFLERCAAEYFDVECKIYVQRNDLNPGTGTFKDLAGTVVGSVLKENNQRRYTVASTGNTAVSYSKYLAKAGIEVYGFIPEYSSKMQEAEVGVFGQKIFRVAGDYEDAKSVAKEFSKKYGILLAAGNFDPMRIEAKKTMVYEWIRQTGEVPTVYVQALSGGTGPLGIAKACRELEQIGISQKMPRQLLVQTNQCAPMAHAWEEAKQSGFPEGWETDYPVYKNPDTVIATLTTGNPKTYPIISQLVRDSDGEITTFNEERAVDVARFIAYETSVCVGPAAAIPVGGFIQGLSDGHVKDGDIVALNIGEGAKRAPKFMESLLYTSQKINTVSECSLFDRAQLRDKLWDPIYQEVTGN